MFLSKNIVYIKYMRGQFWNQSHSHFSELLNRFILPNAVQSALLRPPTSALPDEFAKNTELSPSPIL